jgi:hypothetical protein
MNGNFRKIRLKSLPGPKYAERLGITPEEIECCGGSASRFAPISLLKSSSSLPDCASG